MEVSEGVSLTLRFSPFSVSLSFDDRQRFMPGRIMQFLEHLSHIPAALRNGEKDTELRMVLQAPGPCFSLSPAALKVLIWDLLVRSVKE